MTTMAHVLGTPRRLVKTWPSWVSLAAVLVLAAAIAVGGIAVRRSLSSSATDTTHRSVPQSVAMENLTGVRFSQVSVVADGGLITLSYVVLDNEKATIFQANTAHPPVLSSESRKLSTSKVALMKQGHSLRAGQTYYLVYDNSADAIRPGESVTITDGAVTLTHVPVL